MHQVQCRVTVGLQTSNEPFFDNVLAVFVWRLARQSESSAHIANNLCAPMRVVKCVHVLAPLFSSSDDPRT